MSTQPYIITPDVVKSQNVDTLNRYIEENKSGLHRQLLSSGAILFRGFNVHEASDFEKIALQVDSDLKNDYLGTSPRNIVNGTKYVFSASELPPYYPIMQHCEMSFLPTAPRRIMFYCFVEPKIGGETPICDFRKVAADMNPKIKQEFKDKGLLVIRNYCAPGKEEKNSFQLKPWVEMFQSTDKTVVEQKCAVNDIQVEWLKDDALRLISKHDAFKIHPETGEEAWFNHLQVFHTDAAAIEYQKIARRQKTINSWGLNLYLQVLTMYKRLTENPINHSMHVQFADGTEIHKKYVQHIQDLIWKHLYFLKWKKGDVIVVDNFSTSHGRMPFKGPRSIQVAWTA
ncbi:MAG: TauD/TfdA family dioxygenase [Chitinophagales bacterium]|nr:TauD/TfdA family dioxygenase [Chitinophagales bacterium]